MQQKKFSHLIIVAVILITNFIVANLVHATPVLDQQCLQAKIKVADKNKQQEKATNYTTYQMALKSAKNKTAKQTAVRIYKQKLKTISTTYTQTIKQARQLCLKKIKEDVTKTPVKPDSNNSGNLVQGVENHPVNQPLGRDAILAVIPIFNYGSTTTNDQLYEKHKLPGIGDFESLSMLFHITDTNFYKKYANDLIQAGWSVSQNILIGTTSKGNPIVLIKANKGDFKLDLGTEDRVAGFIGILRVDYIPGFKF